MEYHRDTKEHNIIDDTFILLDRRKDMNFDSQFNYYLNYKVINEFDEKLERRANFYVDDMSTVIMAIINILSQRLVITIGKEMTVSVFSSAYTRKDSVFSALLGYKNELYLALKHSKTTSEIWLRNLYFKLFGYEEMLKTMHENVEVLELVSRPDDAEKVKFEMYGYSSLSGLHVDNNVEIISIPQNLRYLRVPVTYGEIECIKDKGFTKYVGESYDTYIRELC